MRDSLIVSFIVRIYQTLSVWYSNSILGKALDGLYNAVANSVLNSIFGRFFTAKSNDGSYFRNSILYKVLGWFYNLFRKPVGTLNKARLEIADTSVIHDICGNFFDISTSTYGIILFFAGVTGIVLKFFLSGELFDIKGYLCYAVIVLGAILLVINRTPANLAQGSRLIRGIRSFFVDDGNIDNDNPLYLQEETHKVRYNLVAALLGVSLGALFSVYSLIHFVMIVGAVVGIAVVFRYPEAGLFIFVAGSPFLPTMVQVGLVALCGVSTVVKLMSNPRFRLKTGNFDIFVLFFMAIIVYGFVASFDFKGSMMMGLVYLMFTGSYFLITNLVTSTRKWKIFVVGFVASAVLVALYGVMQNYLGVSSTESWVDENMFEDIKVRVFSTFDNPNVLGEYLIIAITLALGFVWSEKWTKKPWYALAFILFALCMVFTWSRGAWLGLAGAVFLFAVIKDKRLAVIIIVGVILLPIIGSEAILSRLGSVGDTADTSTAYRVSIWISSARMIKQFWISGIGLGSGAFTSIYGDYARSGASFALHSHNVFLQIMLSFGVTGTIVFLLMMIYYVRQVYSHLRASSKREDLTVTNALLLAMSCGILGYYAQGLTDNVWYNYKMYGISWIIIALTIAGIRAADKEK